jgi:hypothetical protein
MDDPTVVEPTRLDWLSARSASNESLNSLDPTIVESTRLNTPPISPPNLRMFHSNESESNIVVKAMLPCQEVQQMIVHCLHNNHDAQTTKSCDLFAGVFDSKTSRMSLDCRHYFPT